ncbi:MAG: DUF2783 domain-containing protein [Roseitalea sp.]|nr:DUF2783 domain-containing protein [Roseitalea sp.]MBO6950924.1 DUF2783 domain-containing protein [Rhizobiaceae bacterium]MBO6591089.1 DUF2783 domain-containing protein [Roseitalea sp.]MBO6599653.1 DUF2783 domain-containing protein [Roseitalea sp.]MBO6613904.1 DUF2783 domain-containing protein [Roseitalea sp.]
MTMRNLSQDKGLGARSDSFCQMLLEAHASMGEAESRALNVRLVLLMASDIGTLDRIDALPDAARPAQG